MYLGYVKFGRHNIISQIISLYGSIILKLSKEFLHLFTFKSPTKDQFQQTRKKLTH